MARALSTRSRFIVAYLLLGAAVGAALGAFIVLVQRPAPPPAPAWSSWRPDDAASAGSQLNEIADHVGAGYRLADGNPLVNVQIDNRNLRSIVVPKVAKPQGPGDFSTYDRSSTAIYLLCGYGAHCRVTPGKQTKARGTVLRREALELALYTLKYLHPVDNVLVFFPPLGGEKAVSATLFFHRGDLESSLDHPLRKTLPQAVPPAPGQIRPAEKRMVDDLTKATYYHYLRTEDVQGYGNVVELLPPSGASA